jgi:nucleoside-diphosphate-sugar epimerase
MPDVLILGCGYTGRRVAQRLLARGCTVICTARNPREGVVALDLEQSGAIGRLREMVTPGIRVLHSVPPLEGEMDRLAIEAVHDAARVVYLSTTGVYGDAEFVDHTTAAVADGPRIRTEQAVLNGPWSSLVLRPAAIYGPGRIARRKRRTASIVSRIHVDDLAAHAEAALFSDVTGAWPVADELPCPSREVAEFHAALLGVAPPVPEPAASHGRRVDGRAIRQRLGITLKYASYRTGIPAALEEERLMGDPRRGDAPMP